MVLNFFKKKNNDKKSNELPNAPAMPDATKGTGPDTRVTPPLDIPDIKIDNNQYGSNNYNHANNNNLNLDPPPIPMNSNADNPDYSNSNIDYKNPNSSMDNNNNDVPNFPLPQNYQQNNQKIPINNYNQPTEPSFSQANKPKEPDFNFEESDSQFNMPEDNSNDISLPGIGDNENEGSPQSNQQNNYHNQNNEDNQKSDDAEFDMPYNDGNENPSSEEMFKQNQPSNNTQIPKNNEDITQIKPVKIDTPKFQSESLFSQKPISESTINNDLNATEEKLNPLDIRSEFGSGKIETSINPIPDHFQKRVINNSVFISVDDFKSVAEIINSLDTESKTAEDSLLRVKDIVLNKEKVFDKWHKDLEQIEHELIQLDKLLFNV